MRSARAVGLAIAAALATSDGRAEDAGELAFALGPDGRIGAWLVVGPFAAKDAGGIAEAPHVGPIADLVPRRGDALGPARREGNKDLPPPRWTLASSRDGAIDLLDALDKPKGAAIAYAAATIHVARAGRHHLLSSGDDGIAVWVDGVLRYARDGSHPPREDAVVIPLELEAGAHRVVVGLHQVSGGWALRARLVDAALARPDGARVSLAGVPRREGPEIARAMSRVSVDLAATSTREGVSYAPRLLVRFGGGAPVDTPLAVRARLAGDDAFDLAAGSVPTDGPEACELRVLLPRTRPRAADAAIEVDVAGRRVTLPFPARGAEERALARAERALAALPPDAPSLGDGSRESVEHLVARMKDALASADGDAVALADEARELERAAGALEAGRDPFDDRGGPSRRAFRSALDGGLSEVGVYVPPSYARARERGAIGARRWPLIVGLHGLNGRPMAMLRWLFGGDDPKRPGAWEERHFTKFFANAPAIDAFVVTPDGRGNTMYRELGEVDVLEALAWARRRYPIDDARITITGPSMGGIGAASVPLHHPELFAAAAPLCGYHSYLIRSGIAGRPLRPWERHGLEERSNVTWADNGAHLPLYVVHGTRDLPQENSGVLIDRYEKLGFSVKHEHPDLGHNVWQTTYEDLKGARWLLSRRRDVHPRRVHLKTSRPRWGDAAWVHVRGLVPGAWAEVDARVTGRDAIRVTTRDVRDLALDRDPSLVDPGATVTVELDGAKLAFGPGATLEAHRDAAGAWAAGARDLHARDKRGRVTGPLRDVFHEPVLFVYASAPAEEARANEAVARAFAAVPGARVDYPVMSDEAFAARGEPLANDRALFLVGRDNRVLAALEQAGAFPIKVARGAVHVGATRLEGRELGAAFVHPNPVRPDRYVVVLAGASVEGTLRARSLPELLPDFVVWDDGVGDAHGQLLLGGASLRAAGDFTSEWSLPKTWDDPLARRRAP